MAISYEAFYEEWVSSIIEDAPSSREKGRRFAYKLLQDWTEVSDESDDIIYCDGAGDGGIDVACLRRGESDENGISEGDTWYLVQTKYGTAFQSTQTLLSEAQKVIETLDGRRDNLSSLAGNVLERVKLFRQQAAPERDRIVLVFGTGDNLTEAEIRALGDIREMGRGRIGTLFDVETVSVKAIFERLIEIENAGLAVTLSAKLAPSGDGLLVGAIPLLDLYRFLKTYRATTEDLDRIYEKNVRRFLGWRKVNKSIRETLNKEPEHFGLYNNGITVVVRDFQVNDEKGEIILRDPYIVNGCQTTRSLWSVFDEKLGSGGTGTNPQLEKWRDKAEQGVVVTKIVRIGSDDSGLLQNVTRYTNSQNAVKEQDFHALSNSFNEWMSRMGSRYEVYLEIQRGGWDSYRVKMQQLPNEKALSKYANAVDLLKTYGAAWLRIPGTAFGGRSDFAPNGSAFQRILKRDEQEPPFNEDDLYAAYCLQTQANDMGFRRASDQLPRRQTRYIFLFVFGELLRNILIKTGNANPNPVSITTAVLKLTRAENRDAFEQLLNAAANAVDDYFTSGNEYVVYDEPIYRDSGTDMNRFLKSERLGSAEHTPRLFSLLAVVQHFLNYCSGQNESIRSVVTRAIV